MNRSDAINDLLVRGATAHPPAPTPQGTGGEQEREVPGGRLSGPDAGMRNMIRNLEAGFVVADARAYAAGERRLTVHHGLEHDDTVVQELLAVVDDAVRGLSGSPAGHPFTSEGRYTSWRFQPPGADVAVHAALAAVEQVGAGRWAIEADTYLGPSA